jgi:Mrp family chromosome partitioning ATPase
MSPSTGSEVFSFFDNINELLGVVIVTRLTDISALGMTRTNKPYGREFRKRLANWE